MESLYLPLSVQYQTTAFHFNIHVKKFCQFWKKPSKGGLHPELLPPPPAAGWGWKWDQQKGEIFGIVRKTGRSLATSCCRWTKLRNELNLLPFAGAAGQSSSVGSVPQWWAPSRAGSSGVSTSRSRTGVCLHILKPPGAVLGNLSRIIVFIQPLFNYNSPLSESQLSSLAWVAVLYYSPQLTLLTFYPSTFLPFMGTGLFFNFDLNSSFFH